MRVVIVDDTHINLVLMSRLIGKLDEVDTVAFQSAREALAWCNAHPCDLLIVDYMMPDLNGLELIAGLEAHPRERPPVLMVTASVDVEVRHRALENGASDFLIKPIDKVEFLARTRNMLQLRRATVSLQNRASWLASEVGKATAELRAREQETIMLLGRASEYRDPETGAHIQRMAQYSRLIAAELGLSQQEQDDISSRSQRSRVAVELPAGTGTAAAGLGRRAAAAGRRHRAAARAGCAGPAGRAATVGRAGRRAARRRRRP